LPTLEISLFDGLVFLFFHLLFELFVLHGAFDFEGFHLLGFAGAFDAKLLLFFSYFFDEIGGFFGAFAEEMELVAPDFPFFAGSSVGLGRGGDECVAAELALANLFPEIDQFVLDEHVPQFDPVGGFGLSRHYLLFPLHFPNLKHTVFYILLDAELHLAHDQIELVSQGLVIEHFFLYSCDEVSEIVILRRNIHLFLDELQPLLDGHAKVLGQHFH
jgi:hypothetical protein